MMNKVIGAVKYFWNFLNDSWPAVKEFCYSALPLLTIALLMASLWVFLLM